MRCADPPICSGICQTSFDDLCRYSAQQNWLPNNIFAKPHVPAQDRIQVREIKNPHRINDEG